MDFVRKHFVRKKCEYCLEPTYLTPEDQASHLENHVYWEHPKVGEKFVECLYCAGRPGNPIKTDMWMEGTKIKASEYDAHVAREHTPHSHDKFKRCKVCLWYQHPDDHKWHEEGHWSTDEVQTETRSNCPYCDHWYKNGKEYNDHVQGHQNNKDIKQLVMSY